MYHSYQVFGKFCEKQCFLFPKLSHLLKNSTSLVFQLKCSGVRTRDSTTEIQNRTDENLAVFLHVVCATAFDSGPTSMKLDTPLGH